MIIIEIFRDGAQWLLKLYLKAYTNKVLERFGVEKWSTSAIPIQKRGKLKLIKCLKNELECKQMKKIPFTSIIGSLMYAKTCTRPDITFTVGILDRYQSNPGLDRCKTARKVLRYL